MKPKSLTFRIFINTFFVGTLIYFICAFLFISNMYGYFEKQIFSELKTESLFLENSVLNQQLDHLSELQTENRITLIHSDGTVYLTIKLMLPNLKIMEQDRNSLRQKTTAQFKFPVSLPQ